MVDPSSLTFTSANWNTAQTITITGMDDDSVDGSIAYTIVIAAATSTDTDYNGFDPEDVGVTNSDNDVSSVGIAPSEFTLGEGSSVEYTITVATHPSAPFTLALSFDTHQLLVNGSSTSPIWLAFTNGGSVTIPVTVLNNAGDNDSRTVTIVHTITSSGAAEYPTSLAIPSVVIHIGDVPPPPPVPTCEANNFDEGGVVRTGVPDAIRYAINCRVLYQNGASTTWLGAALYSEANLGIPGLLDLGVEQAIDIFSPSGLNYFEGGAVFCLRGSGALLWLAASGSPRHVEIIGSYTVPEFPGFTCATLFEPGTFILVQHDPAQ